MKATDVKIGNRSQETFLIAIHELQFAFILPWPPQIAEASQIVNAVINFINQKLCFDTLQ